MHLRARRWLAAAAALGLTACTSSGTAATRDNSPASATAASAPASSPAAPAAAVQNAFVSVTERVRPSVVEIRTSSGLGSGVVFDAKGDIVTNAHVVGNASSFQVLQASSASSRPATLALRYRPDDLAVIKVSGAANLRPASFGDSAKLKVGDLVLAIGNPLGLASSVTEGIVSAVGRTVSEPAGAGSPGPTLPDTIQTSAAINPGNSGGALVDLAGQVVGIPTLAAVDQQIGGAAPGIGFAISSDVVTRIARQLIATGQVTSSGRAALGVAVTTATAPDGTPAGAVSSRSPPAALPPRPASARPMSSPPSTACPPRTARRCQLCSLACTRVRPLLCASHVPAAAPPPSTSRSASFPAVRPGAPGRQGGVLVFPSFLTARADPLSAAGADLACA
jgi:putative serine protease PepD